MSNEQSRYQGKPKGRRWPLITAIVLFHVLALYGLARFLAPVITASVEREMAEGLTVIVSTAESTPTPQPDAGLAGAPPAPGTPLGVGGGLGGQ